MSGKDNTACSTGKKLQYLAVSHTKHLEHKVRQNISAVLYQSKPKRYKRDQIWINYFFHKKNTSPVSLFSLLFSKHNTKTLIYDLVKLFCFLSHTKTHKLHHTRGHEGPECEQRYTIFTQMQDKVSSLNFLLKNVRATYICAWSTEQDHAKPECSEPDHA